MVTACQIGPAARSRVIDINHVLETTLRCPACQGTFEEFASTEPAGRLSCTACGRSFPVVNGIPRFVEAPRDTEGARTQASFGYEWTHFNDWSQSGGTNFADYFQGIDLQALRDSVVLDAGCGMGRHARQIAPFARQVLALDFSRAIDQAKRNTADRPNVRCIQADLLALPLRDGAFDFIYSLGVLHHLDRTEDALRALVRKLRPGGRIRVYLYWKREGWKGQLLNTVNAARLLTTRLPFGLLRPLCAVLSAGLFGGVVVPYRALSAAGIHAHEDWPLFVYTKYPFNVLYNDQFDRFSAPIEKRYTPADVSRLLQSVGLIDVAVRPCFGWLGDGTKPA
jgi:SAM-dependent methyltransferase